MANNHEKKSIISYKSKDIFFDIYYQKSKYDLTNIITRTILL